jgi:hypothetical protein
MSWILSFEVPLQYCILHHHNILTHGKMHMLYIFFYIITDVDTCDREIKWLHMHRLSMEYPKDRIWGWPETSESEIKTI